jgi:hypothetical protein
MANESWCAASGNNAHAATETTTMRTMMTTTEIGVITAVGETAASLAISSRISMFG